MRISTLTTPLGPDYLSLKQIEGAEGINTLFRYVLQAYSIHDDIEAKSLLGKAVTISIYDQHGDPVYLNAMVAQFKRLGRKRNARYTQYEAILVPWVWFAKHRANCKIFEKKTAVEIVTEVLGFYPFPVLSKVGGQETLLHVVQYNESDFDFVSRLMEEHGINYRFAHEDGIHTLVLSNNVSAFGSVPGHDTIPFRADDHLGIADEETINQWTPRQTIKSGSFTTSDYDYRAPGARLEQYSSGTYASKGHDFADLPVYHWLGQGRYTDMGIGRGIATLRQDQQEQEFADIEADSDVRALALGASGLRFTLAKHVDPARNIEMIVIASHMFFKENPGASADGGEHTDWRVGFTAVSSRCVYRPKPVTPLPYIRGPQTAVVVGPAGQELWVNDLGQVKIRLWWDRETPDSGWELWVRVSSGWAGNGLGEVLLPRIGDEVIVSFLDGNPSHPIITGRVVNANRPPVAFSRTGSLPSNQALAGIKSRELYGSGYGQLFFDDTTGEISSHLQSDHAKTQLNLGYLTHPRSGSAEPRGNGFELRTDAAGALRAAKGVLVSAYARPNAGGNALSRDELTTLLKEALDLAKTIGDFAAKNLGNISDPKPEETLSKAVKDLGNGSNAETGGNGATPLIALSAPAGIALGTPLSTTIATGEHIDLVSGQNQQFTAGKKMNLHAGEGLSNFSVKGGIKSIAHQGPHIIKAHDDVIQIAADQSVTVTSSHGNVTVAADKYVLLTAGGGFIKIADGNIQMHCPGTIDMKAGNYSLTGPASMNYTLPVMPNDVCKPCLHNAANSGAPFAVKG